MVSMVRWPLWLAALVLVGGGAVLAMAGTAFTRRRVGLDKLVTNNEVAGFKFATVGVLYAVLLAFAVVIVWEKFSDAENQVAREAGAAATLYRLSDGMGTAGPALRGTITTYLNTAIAQDWPAMAEGGSSPAVTAALNRVYAAALAYHPPDPRGQALLAEALQQLDQLTEARRDRLVMAHGAVPGVLWAVLVIGAVLTLAFTFFFGSENLRAQTLMTGTLAVLIMSGLLVIVAIDHPFTGTVSVTPEPLTEVLESFVAPTPP